MYYLNIETLPQSGVGNSTILGLLSYKIHHLFEEKKIQFALAFPQAEWGENPHLGKLLRVFTKEKADLETLAESIEGNSKLDPYCKIRRVRKAPENCEKCVAYLRFRVPGFRNKHPEQLEAQRRRRLTRLETKETFPFLRMQSHSNGNTFSLFLEKRTEEGNRTIDIQTDSYGLSKRSNPTFLPDFP